MNFKSRPDRTMYICIRNGNQESLFHAQQFLRGLKGSGTSMAIRPKVPIDQNAPRVELVSLGFGPKLQSKLGLTLNKF